MENHPFATVPLREKIVLHPASLTSRVNDVVFQRLKNKFEGICSHHGYIRKDSIRVTSMSQGQVRAFSLNGDVEFVVDFSADICNPCKGSFLRARVVNINRFGVLAEVSIDEDDLENRSTIMEVVVPRVHVSSLVQDDQQQDDSAKIDALQVGMMIGVEVLGKRFQLNDRKLSVLGRLAEHVEKSYVGPPGSMRGDLEDEDESDADGLDEESEKSSEDEDEDEDVVEDDDLNEDGEDFASEGDDDDEGAF